MIARWWQARRAPVEEGRWVVVDVETSGLDPARDRLLAIAAIGVRVDWAAGQATIELADSFEVVLRQEQPSSRENILLHGIGAGRQAAGVPAARALQAFATFAAHSPLLAFHAGFDQTLVRRHVQAVPGLQLPNPWLDIEHLCAVAFPQERARSLDEWLERFGISCLARHQAAADALAEAQLLLRAWPRLAGECRSWDDVRRLAARHRWLPRG